MIKSKTATAAVPLHLGDRFAQKKNAALVLCSYWVLIDSDFPNTPSI